MNMTWVAIYASISEVLTKIEQLATSPQNPSKVPFPSENYQKIVIKPPLRAGLNLGESLNIHSKASVEDPILVKAQNDLNCFVSVLRSFAPGRTIDEIAFDMSLDDMTEKLEELRVVVEKVADTKSALSWQLSYASHMFEFMQSNRALVQYHTVIEGKIHSLICTLARLNTAFFVLLDLYGTPDARSAGFERKVARFLQIMLRAREAYADLSRVNPSRFLDTTDRNTYETQYNHAEKTSQLLILHLPEGRKEKV